MTTENPDGSANIAPMGPIVDADIQCFTLRPYQTSTTYANLRRAGEGVFHVTDNVFMLAQAAIGQLSPNPEMMPCEIVRGNILCDACRWYALRVESIDDREPRTTIVARVAGSGRLRDFFGFNRAKHAVVEAAILATRVDLLPASEIQDQFARLRVWVEKTGGAQERQAFELLRGYVHEHSRGAPGIAGS